MGCSISYNVRINLRTAWIAKPEKPIHNINLAENHQVAPVSSKPLLSSKGAFMYYLVSGLSTMFLQLFYTFFIIP
jgi:hypothetical protein